MTSLEYCAPLCHTVVSDDRNMNSKKNREEYKRIGEWLKARRILSGLTQAQLGVIIGRSVSYIRRYEAGSRLELVQFAKVATALNVDPREVFEMCTQRETP